MSIRQLQIASHIYNSIQLNAFVLLLITSTANNVLAQSFSIHLVHPDNDSIGSSPNADIDLRDYEKFTARRDGKDEVLWVSRKVELDISDIDEVNLTFPDQAFRREDLENLKKKYPSMTPEIDKLIESIDPQPRPTISMSFTPLGSRRLADFTARNVKRRAAIILEGKLLIAPVIIEPITGGTLQMIGDYSKQEAQTIIDRINELIAVKRRKASFSSVDRV